MPSDFPAAFAALREILKKNAAGLTVLSDTATNFTVASPAIAPNGKPMWFGGVMLMKSAVTYHLMCCYYHPRLEASIPPELLARKQGKTCFNFQRPDAKLFAMLDDVTRLGRQHWERHGLLEPGPIPQERFDAALRAGGTDVDALAALRKRKGRAAARKRAATIAKTKTPGTARKRSAKQ